MKNGFSKVVPVTAGDLEAGSPATTSISGNHDNQTSSEGETKTARGPHTHVKAFAHSSTETSTEFEAHITHNNNNDSNGTDTSDGNEQGNSAGRLNSRSPSRSNGGSTLRRSSSELSMGSPFGSMRNWDSSLKSGKSSRFPKRSASMARKHSLMRLKKRVARTRTRDRTIEDRVDVIEQKLAKYMYQTMGLRAAFEFYNKDGNAGLDKDELADILTKCNAEYRQDELDHLMARYDEDGNGTVTLGEFTTTVPISRPRLLEYLHTKDDQRAACLSLPVTVLFFIWFVVLLSLHDVTTSAYSVETGVVKDLTTRKSAVFRDDFYEADTIDKVWDWLDTVLIPIAFDQHVPGANQRPVPPYAWGSINSYNHYLGAGISMGQTRGSLDSCSILALEGPLNASCHPWRQPNIFVHEGSWTSNDTFGVPLCSTLFTELNCTVGVDCAGLYDPHSCYNDVGISDYVAATASAFEVVNEENAAIEPYPTSTLPSFEVLFDASQSKDEILAQLQYLKQREWIDKQTKYLQLLFAVYNGEYGTYMAVNFLWEINRGGSVIPSIKLQDSVPADPYDNNNGWFWFVDIAWIVMVLAQAAGEFGEMKDQGFYYWRQFWNILDWIQIVLTLCLMGVWYDICYNGIYPVGDIWLETYNSSDVFVRQDPTSKLLSVLGEARDYRTGVVINILVILVRFFKAFLVQPRLSIVTHTFIRSFVDVIHFMVILACLLFGFVFTGIYLLGHKIEDFSHIGESLLRLYETMLAAPLLKWDEVKVAAAAADGLSMAVLWYVLFLFIICLVFRSMLLAIILTAYAEARNAAGRKARTMWAQLGDVITEAQAGARGALQLTQVIGFLEEPVDPHVVLQPDALYVKDAINILDVLRMYNKPGNIRSGNSAQMEYRREYARKYMLNVVAEYFDFIDLKDPSESENRQKEAFQRISELDSDFKDLEKRLDRMQAELTNGFSKLISALESGDNKKTAKKERGGSASGSDDEGEQPIRLVAFAASDNV